MKKTVHTTWYALGAQYFATSLGFLFYSAVWRQRERKEKKMLELLITKWKDSKFQQSMCADILVIQL